MENKTRKYGLQDPNNRFKPERKMTSAKLSQARDMLSLGYKQKAIAAYIGVERGTLSRYLNGKLTIPTEE